MPALPLPLQGEAVRNPSAVGVADGPSLTSPPRRAGEGSKRGKRTSTPARRPRPPRRDSRAAWIARFFSNGAASTHLWPAGRPHPADLGSRERRGIRRRRSDGAGGAWRTPMRSSPADRRRHGDGGAGRHQPVTAMANAHSPACCAPRRRRPPPPRFNGAAAGHPACRHPAAGDPHVAHAALAAKAGARASTRRWRAPSATPAVRPPI